jgi:hypothetical protein
MPLAWQTVTDAPRTYDPAVKLYTPLSNEDAARAKRGEYPSEPLFWVDRPTPEEATEDAIWVEIEIPSDEAAPHEQAVHPELGYREFELPPEVASQYRAQRIPPPN